MNGNQKNTILSNNNSNGSGYKVVEINLKDTTENLYAVVTPVKIKD